MYELLPAEQKEGWLFYNMDDEGEQRHGEKMLYPPERKIV